LGGYSPKTNLHIGTIGLIIIGIVLIFTCVGRNDILLMIKHHKVLLFSAIGVITVVIIPMWLCVLILIKENYPIRIDFSASQIHSLDRFVVFNERDNSLELVNEFENYERNIAYIDPFILPKSDGWYKLEILGNFDTNGENNDIGKIEFTSLDGEDVFCEIPISHSEYGVKQVFFSEKFDKDKPCIPVIDYYGKGTFKITGFSIGEWKYWRCYFALWATVYWIVFWIVLVAFFLLNNDSKVIKVTSTCNIID